MHGALAVHFFWILSGFIFFHVYKNRQDVALRTFFVNRFSRLYPLHFLTLCLVAALQWVNMGIFGYFQIYPMNDIWHFVLNLFMASHWGFQKGYSFNAPIWSISVEVLTYGMFFAFLKALGVRLLTSVFWLGWSLILYKSSSGPVFECAALFSLGGVINQGHSWLTRREREGLMVVYAAVMAVLISSAAVYWGWIGKLMGLKWVVFPSLIWLAAALDAKQWSSGALGLTLGKLTYASYLLHVPVQIVLIMWLDGVVGHRDAIGTPTFLVMYMAAVFVLSAVVYRYVERPLQISCRLVMLKKST